MQILQASPDVHGSEIYVAALFPNNNVKTGKTPDSRNLVGVIDGYKGEPITYYAGAGWSRYDVSNFTWPGSSWSPSS